MTTIADLRVSDIGKRVRIEYEGTDIAGELLDYRTKSEHERETIQGGTTLMRVIKSHTTDVTLALPVATITIPSGAHLEILEDQP